jgi:RNA polymerase sigma-70 factor (ECF subfamily)
MIHTSERNADQEIIQWYRGGMREEALRRFAEQYQARLYTLARRLLGNHDDALDALQEILMHVDQSLPQFKGESTLYTWAFRLATNVCLNYRRRLARVHNGTPLDEALINTAWLSTQRPSDNPDAMCRTQFRQYLVEQGLRHLPETQRVVLVLCDLEGMTAPDVAKILGIDTHAVKARLHRARVALKNMIEKEFKALGIDIEDMHTLECTPHYLTATSRDAMPAAF